jgi:hypothetical protein
MRTTTTLSKQHFIFIAKLIKDARGCMTPEERTRFDTKVMPQVLADLANTNSAFNKARFVEACETDVGAQP